MSALGQAYLSYGKYDEAISAMERGIKKGGVTDADEAQISLGIAHMKKGQKDQARQAFKAVKDGLEVDSIWPSCGTIRSHGAPDRSL